MKKIFMLLFFILNINIFSYNYDDYSIFIQGKNAYEKGTILQLKKVLKL